MNQGTLSQIVIRMTEYHRIYMEEFTTEYGLVALMSFVAMMAWVIAIVLIPFTLMMGLPLTVDFLIPILFSIVPVGAWTRVFWKYLKFRHTKQFYPERLI